MQMQGKTGNTISCRWPCQLSILRLRANYSLQCPPGIAAIGKNVGEDLSKTYFDAAKVSFRQREMSWFSDRGHLSCLRLHKQCPPGREKTLCL